MAGGARQRRRAGGAGAAAAAAGALALALLLVSGVQAENNSNDLTECSLKKKQCKKSPYCRWTKSAPRGSKCATATDACSAVQGKQRRKKCNAITTDLGGAANMTCQCTRRPEGKGKCGNCVVKSQPESPTEIVEELNRLYKSTQGLLVTKMSSAFENKSLAHGVPLYACPPGPGGKGVPGCTWHTAGKSGRLYSSATFVQRDLDKKGMRLYGCDGRGDVCWPKSGALLLVYETSKTVIGAAFPYDGDTDMDGGAAGTSKNFEPAPCPEDSAVEPNKCSCAVANRNCAKYPPIVGNATAIDNCMKQYGGQLGDIYHDAFSTLFGFSSNGTERSEGTLPPNFSNSDNIFIEIQKFYDNDENLFKTFDLLPPDDSCRSISTPLPHPGVPGPPLSPSCWCTDWFCSKNNCLRYRCFLDKNNPNCNNVPPPLYHNEVVIRNANPETLFPGDTDEASRETYTKWYCDNQIPVALAYAPGSNSSNFWDPSRMGGSNTTGEYITAYQTEFRKICGSDYVPPLVLFDYKLAGGAPFKTLA